MNQSNNKQYYWIYPLIFYLSGSALIWFFIPAFSSRLENDSLAYFHLLKTYEKTGSFYDAPAKLSTWFGLGYPFFMSFFRMFYHSNYIIIIAQIILACCSILLLYASAGYFTSASKKVTIWLASINLGYMIYPHFFLTETLMVFLITLGFFLLLKNYHVKKPNNILFFFAAIIFGFSMLIKPSILYLIPFWIISFLLQNKKKMNTKIKSIFIFACSFALLPLIFMHCHYRIFGYHYLKSVDKVNLYYFFLPHLQANISGTSFEEEQKRLHKQYPIQNYADPHAFNQIQNLCIQTMLTHPVAAVQVWITQMLKTLMGLYTNHLKVLLSTEIKGGECSFFKFSGTLYQKIMQYLVYKTDSYFLIFLGIFELIIRLICIFFALIGIYQIIIQKDWCGFWFLIIPTGYFWGITGADGCGRLRMFVEPFFIILSSVGYQSIKNYYNRP